MIGTPLFNEKKGKGYGDQKSPNSFSVKKKVRKQKDDIFKGVKKSKTLKEIRKVAKQGLKDAWYGNV